VISPISWSHHLVWVIPAIIVLADAAVRRRRGEPRPAAAGPGSSAAAAGPERLRPPIWYPTLTGLAHGVAAIVLYLLFVISPIWPYEHQLPEVSHYQDGLFGALMENSAGAGPDRAGRRPAVAAGRGAGLLRPTAAGPLTAGDRSTPRPPTGPAGGRSGAVTTSVPSANTCRFQIGSRAFTSSTSRAQASEPRRPGGRC
jgi:hypothetical protein